MGTAPETTAGAELRASVDRLQAALAAKDAEIGALRQELDRSRAEAAVAMRRAEREAEAEARGQEAGRWEQGRILQGILAERDARVRLLERELAGAAARGNEAGRLAQQGVQVNRAVLQTALEEAQTQAAAALASSGARHQEELGRRNARVAALEKALERNQGQAASTAARHQEALAERDARIGVLERALEQGKSQAAGVLAKALENAKGQGATTLAHTAAHYQGAVAERDTRIAALEQELQETKARLFEVEINDAAAPAPAPGGGGSGSTTAVAPPSQPLQPDVETIKLEYEAKLALAGQAFTAYQQEVTVLANQIQRDMAAMNARHQAEVAAKDLEIERLRAAATAAAADGGGDNKEKEELERLKAEGKKWASEVGQLRRLGERLAERAGELRRRMRGAGVGVDDAATAAVAGDKATKRVRFGSDAQGGGGGGGGGGAERPVRKQGP